MSGEKNSSEGVQRDQGADPKATEPVDGLTEAAKAYGGTADVDESRPGGYHVDPEKTERVVEEAGVEIQTTEDGERIAVQKDDPTP